MSETPVPNASAIRLGDRVQMSWGQKGTVCALDRNNGDCLVRYDNVSDPSAGNIISSWTKFDRVTNLTI